MSSRQRCFVALALGGLAFFVGSAGWTFAQGIASKRHTSPTRLPTIQRELIEQLPAGCTGSWATLDPPIFALDTEAADTGPQRPTATLPNVHSNPFARLASDTTVSQDTADGTATDELLPAQRPKPLGRPPLAADDQLLLLDEDRADELLSDPAADPLAEMSAQADPLAEMATENSGQTDNSVAGQATEAVEPGFSNAATTALPSAVDDIESQYPSAQTCAKCHPGHYDQWRVSGHAYAAVSPMFNRFEQAMQELTQGTVGSFCVRCHAPVATQMCTPPSANILDAAPIVREGITCVACHRIKESVGRTNGDRRIEPGDIHAPVYGATQGAGVHDAIARAGELKLKLSPEDTGPGQPMHQHCGPFEPLDRSDFCASCHQVAVHPGVSLEIVHAQYRSGPAHAKGITCQQCHMGSVPGKPSGYELAPIAELNDKEFGEPRKRSNHLFWGPGYSIAHPGLFPHNLDAGRYTPRQWLAFEYRGGWGTPEFEQSVPAGTWFPPPWDNADDRIDGRKIIDANLLKLDEKRGAAALTLAAAARVDGPHFEHRPSLHSPLRFGYQVCNLSEGHNLPTGSLGAQPQMWLNVALIDPQGRRIWETGYLDRNGDLADLQSTEVAHHRLDRDGQLFNLQSKFLINNVRGTDREAPVPLNFSLDQLVFLRPGAVPVSVLNHPPLIRMEAHSIPPLDSRSARYVVPAAKLCQPGTYRLSVRLRSRPEPPYFMRFVGATPEMIRRLNEHIIDIETDSHSFVIDGPVRVASPTSHLVR